MGWLDDLAKNIEDGVKTTVTDTEKIIDRILGFDER
jgi:hypothetical protein